MRGGLTAFLQLGKRELEAIKNIDITTARKIILTAQAGYELKYFAPDIVKENQQGRINIAIRRNAIKSLYPSAIDINGRIRFKDFSDAVALAGQYFNKAIEKTGIIEELKNNNKILIPATEKGAEFPENEKIVYLKVDKLNR